MFITALSISIKQNKKIIIKNIFAHEDRAPMKTFTYFSSSHRHPHELKRTKASSSSAPSSLLLFVSKNVPEGSRKKGTLYSHITQIDFARPSGGFLNLSLLLRNLKKKKKLKKWKIKKKKKKNEILGAAPMFHFLKTTRELICGGLTQFTGAVVFCFFWVFFSEIQAAGGKAGPGIDKKKGKCACWILRWNRAVFPARPKTRKQLGESNLKIYADYSENQSLWLIRYVFTSSESNNPWAKQPEPTASAKKKPFSAIKAKKKGLNRGARAGDDLYWKWIRTDVCSGECRRLLNNKIYYFKKGAGALRREAIDFDAWTAHPTPKPYVDYPRAGSRVEIAGGRGNGEMERANNSKQRQNFQTQRQKTKIENRKK